MKVQVVDWLERVMHQDKARKNWKCPEREVLTQDDIESLTIRVSVWNVLARLIGSKLPELPRAAELQDK